MVYGEAIEHFRTQPDFGRNREAFALAAWVFSLCLHEFTHASTAVFAGDDSDSTQRYLSFNPLHYVNPLFSIGSRSCSSYWAASRFRAVWSTSGATGYAVARGRAPSHSPPASNLLLAMLSAIPSRLGPLDAHPALAGALAVIAYFEVMAALLNLLPIPPLDGVGAIAYWLPDDVRNAAYSVGPYSVLILFAFLWYIPPINQALQTGLVHLISAWGIDPYWLAEGLRATFFWQP